MARKRHPEELQRSIERAKRQSVGQLLIRAARLWSEEALRQTQRLDPSVRMAHTHLLPHLDFEGTRLTTLAERMGISKQAAGELVDDLESQGLLERLPDPSDGRAKLIRFTVRGEERILRGLTLLQEMEASLESVVGSRRMSELAKTLGLLAASLEREE